MLKKKYKKKLYSGLKPDSLLVKILSSIPKGIALDIGAGEGRNSIFLAKNGFDVESIDKNSEDLKKCEKFGKEHNLQIKTILSPPILIALVIGLSLGFIYGRSNERAGLKPRLLGRGGAF